MKKKLIGFIIGVLGIPLVAFIGFYIFVSSYYTKGFSFNTRINGVYCTGKNVSEVNEELLKSYTRDRITVSSGYGSDEVILLSDIDYKADFTASLEGIYKDQNPWLWIMNASKYNLKSELMADITFDKDKLLNAVDSLNISKEYSSQREQVTEIRYSQKEGYFLYEDTNALLDMDALYELILKDAYDQDVIYIPDEFFLERKLTKEMSHEKKVWDEVSSFFETKLFYDMGEEIIPISSAVLSNFVVYDASKRDFVRNEDGSVFFDETIAKEYIDKLCDRYETYAKPRDYITFSGEEKHINFSVYGTLIDKAFEEKYFIEAVKNGNEEKHVPKYIKKGYVRGLDDIGDTFIEVDLTNQVMHFIKDGLEEKTFDIVTGKPSAGFATPEMVAYVYRKVPGKYLRGEDYCSYVNFWMPIYDKIGLHDASWQSKFGGNRYLTHGSRGCINMRHDDAEYLYNSIEVGIPVIVYK